MARSFLLPAARLQSARLFVSSTSLTTSQSKFAPSNHLECVPHIPPSHRAVHAHLLFDADLMESCHPQQAGLSVCTVSALPLIVDTPVCPPLVSKCVCLRVRVCVRTRGCPCLVGNDFERRSDTPRNSQYHPISADWNQHGAAAGVVIGRNGLLLQSFGPATFLSFFFATTCFLLGMCRMTADGRDLPQERLSQGEGGGGGGGWWGRGGRTFTALEWEVFCALVR